MIYDKDSDRPWLFLCDHCMWDLPYEGLFSLTEALADATTWNLLPRLHPVNSKKKLLILPVSSST